MKQLEVLYSKIINHYHMDFDDPSDAKVLIFRKN